MGKEITLDLSKMSITYAKNGIGIDHGVLFQTADEKHISYEYLDEDVGVETRLRYEVGFQRTFRDVIPRLELLGYSLSLAEAEYNEQLAWQNSIEERDEALLSFKEFVRFLRDFPISTLDDTPFSETRANSKTTPIDRVKLDERSQRIPELTWGVQDGYSEMSHFGHLLDFMQPYSLLRVLAEVPENCELDLTWQYGPLVEGGYADAADFRAGTPRENRVLIVTEGSSDTHILKRAIEMLKPEVADFVDFMDVSQSHPFSGTGNLVKFAEGLVKIDIQNKVLFLLDNDAEGVVACNKILNMKLPSNIRVTRLPDMKEFMQFRTTGPNGNNQADINGRAVALEHFLDFEAAGLDDPRIRWTSYKKEIDAYQGALEEKERVSKGFVKFGMQPSYKLDKLKALLCHIFDECQLLSVRG